MSEHNGQSADPTLEQLQGQTRLERERARLYRAQAESGLWNSLSESLLPGGFIPARAELFDPGFGRHDAMGRWWLPIGGGNVYARQAGRDHPFIWTDIDLDRARSMAWWLATRNDLAIGALNRLADYTTRTGYEYEARPGKGFEKDGAARALAGMVQRVVEEFTSLNTVGETPLDSDDEDDCLSEENTWAQRERECVVRAVVEGEVFVRAFDQKDGSTLVRFVEPAQVRDPGDRGSVATFGRENAPGDVERIVRTWVTYDGSDYTPVPPSEIAHLKCNVVSTVKRGLSDFYSSGEAFDGVSKMLRNMAATGAVMSAVAWFEKYTRSNAAGLAGAVANERDQNAPRFQNPVSGKYLDYKHYPPGSIPKFTEGREMISAPLASNTQNYVAIVGACLRACGARWGMPEYMISSDASSANFASTLVAGAPFVTATETRQWQFGIFFIRVLWMAVRIAARHGRFRVAGRVYSYREVSRLVDIHPTPPQVAVVDKLQQSHIDQADIQTGVLSIPTRRAHLGLKDEVERENMKKEPPPGRQPSKTEPFGLDFDPGVGRGRGGMGAGMGVGMGGSAPPGSAGGMGGVGESDPGPPPRPGLVFDPSSHRWTRPAPAPKLTHGTSAEADALRQIHTALDGAKTVRDFRAAARPLFKTIERGVTVGRTAALKSAAAAALAETERDHPGAAAALRPYLDYYARHVAKEMAPNLLGAVDMSGGGKEDIRQALEDELAPRLDLLGEDLLHPEGPMGDRDEVEREAAGLPDPAGAARSAWAAFLKHARTALGGGPTVEGPLPPHGSQHDYLAEALWLDGHPDLFEGQREKGVPFQGPSGRWFVVNDGGRVVPAKNPNASAKPATRPRAKKEPKPEKPTVEGAHATIKGMLAAGKVTPEHAKELTEHLKGLTVAQITQLKKELGLKASGNKHELATKVAERALAAGKGGKPEPKEEPKPEPKRKDEGPKPKGEVDEPAVWEAFRRAEQVERARMIRNEVSNVKVPELYDLVKKEIPSLTRAQFHSLLQEWQKQDKLTIGMVNDREAEPRHGEMIELPGTDINPGGLGGYIDLRDEHALAQAGKPEPKEEPRPSERIDPGDLRALRKWAQAQGVTLSPQQEDAIAQDASARAQRDRTGLTTAHVHDAFEAHQRGQAPAPPQAVAPDDHKQRLASALHRAGGDHVSLADLHRDTGLSLPQLHAAAQALRKEGVVTAHGAEGRHGTDATHAAGFDEEGANGTTRITRLSARDMGRLGQAAGGTGKAIEAKTPADPVADLVDLYQTSGAHVSVPDPDSPYGLTKPQFHMGKEEFERRLAAIDSLDKKSLVKLAVDSGAWKGEEAEKMQRFYAKKNRETLLTEMRRKIAGARASVERAHM